MADDRVMQVGGVVHAWRSPDGTFKHALLKLDFRCLPDPFPGIVVIADDFQREAVAHDVMNLRKELPALLEQAPKGAVAYWSREDKEPARKALLASLTKHPTYVG